MAKKKKKKKGSCLYYLFLLVGFLIGAGILFYPTFSDLWNAYRNQQLISSYSTVIEELEPEDYTELWAQARAYNERHRYNVITNVFEDETESEMESETESAATKLYNSLLDPLGNTIMGYVEIPKINVKLAIYHGVGTVALENGSGHIEGTSLPIGGDSTHSVISAHRGLPSAKLFTDLDQLTVGDVFLVHVLDETLAYKVDQILTVLPYELDALQIEEGRDLMTMVTCTPYGVNSHRLLVRGERTGYVEEEVEKVETIVLRNPLEGTNRGQTLLVVALMGFIVFLVLLNIILSIRDRRRRKRKRREQELAEREKE